MCCSRDAVGRGSIFADSQQKEEGEDGEICEGLVFWIAGRALVLDHVFDDGYGEGQLWFGGWVLIPVAVVEPSEREA